MTMMGQEKPTLEELGDELAHHGVLGMKWGKHRAKATTGQIKEARKRQVERFDNANAATRKLNRVAGEGGNKKQVTSAFKAREKAIKDINTHLDDAAIAARMTRGEKAVSVLLTGPIGLALIAGTSARSRHIENLADKQKKP